MGNIIIPYWGSSQPSFNPLNFTPTLWLDFGDSGTVTDNSGIEQITDKSGNGNTYSQVTVGSRPAYTNGQGIFDGVDDHLDGGQILTAAAVDTNLPFCIMSVFSIDGIGTDNSGTIWGQATNNDRFRLACDTIPQEIRFIHRNTSSGRVSYTQGNLNLLIEFFAANSVTASNIYRINYITRSPVGSLNGTEGITATPSYIGSRNGIVEALNGKVSEILIFDNRIFTLQEILDFENLYFKLKYPSII